MPSEYKPAPVAHLVSSSGQSAKATHAAPAPAASLQQVPGRPRPAAAVPELKTRRPVMAHPAAVANLTSLRTTAFGNRCHWLGPCHQDVQVCYRCPLSPKGRVPRAMPVGECVFARRASSGARTRLSATGSARGYLHDAKPGNSRIPAICSSL